MLKRFINYYRPYKWLLIMDIVCAIGIAGLDLVTPRFAALMIDEIIPNGVIEILLWWMVGLAVVYLTRCLLQYIVDYWGHILGVKMEFDMRKQMFAHLQRLPISYFDNQQVGKLMSRLVNDLNEISEVAHHGPEDLLVSVVLLIGSVTLMFQASWQLASVMCLLLPLLIYNGVKKNLKFRKTFKEMRKTLATINAQAEDNFSGIRVVKAFVAEEYEQQRFKVGNDAFAKNRSEALKTLAEFGVGIKFYLQLMQWSLFLVGGYLVITKSLLMGSLVEFMLYVQLFQIPVTKISAFIMMYNQGAAGFERFLEIIDIPAQCDDEHLPDLQINAGEIKFHHVSFKYDSSEQLVLRDLDLVIPAGKKVAFVGRSGVGKTTLGALLPRFYELQEGQILIDQQDISQVNLLSLRSQIGIVQQDVYLFAGTFRDNLLYGKPDASDDELWVALQQANLADVVREYSEGLDTNIGQRGVKLSGGQKQRLSLARMFLKQPPIIILDEATSALDNENERLIQNALDQLSQGRTTLIIAHRLSTIINADEIIYLGEEGIIERGNHQQLMDNKGAYYHLVMVQQTL